MISTIEKEIIEKLKKDLEFDAPKISQDQFNNMIDYIMENEKENSKEIVWRLCGCYEELNLNKAIDIFIESRDSYYISELVYYVDDKLSQEYLTKKLIETKDLQFVTDALSNCGNAMIDYLDKKYIDEIKSFYYNKDSNNL